MPRKDGQPLREATLPLPATRVPLKAPHARYRLTMPTPAVNVLWAQEIHPPEGPEPIEWLLITPLPIPAFADAQQIVLWYPFRWRIERFHYTVKTGGCYGERLQWERFAR